MEIFVDREGSTSKSTYGRLSEGGKFYAYSLEDTTREPGVKVKGETCIPPGRYRAEIYYSPTRKREVIQLIGVPGFANIQIHSGNDHTHTLGCILLARSRVNKDFIQGDSKTLEVALTAKAKKAIAAGQPLFVTIRVSQTFEIHMPEIKV